MGVRIFMESGVSRTHVHHFDLDAGRVTDLCDISGCQYRRPPLPVATVLRREPWWKRLLAWARWWGVV